LILDGKIDSIDSNGNIPLHFAVKVGDLSMTKKLLLYGANKYQINNKK
jgi:ankyrin repeat protein